MGCLQSDLVGVFLCLGTLSQGLSMPGKWRVAVGAFALAGLLLNLLGAYRAGLGRCPGWQPDGFWEELTSSRAFMALCAFILLCRGLVLALLDGRLFLGAMESASGTVMAMLITGLLVREIDPAVDQKEA